MTEEKHIEEKVTERKIEVTGDDAPAGTQAPQEKQAEEVSQDKPADNNGGGNDKPADDKED